MSSPRVDAYVRMTALPGIGPWTAAKVGRVAFGDPDAISVGDYALSRQIAFALAGEPRADQPACRSCSSPTATAGPQ